MKPKKKATAAGASSFFGALIGYFILHNNYDETTFGILFGLVSGAMVQISIQDLIPTAFRHDPENSKVTKSIMAGIFVMSGYKNITDMCTIYFC